MDDPASHPHANCTSRGDSLKTGSDSTQQGKHNSAENTSWHDDFCHVAPNPESIGTKRGRSGSLTTVPRGSSNAQDDETSCSDTGWSSDSDSCSNSTLAGYDTDGQDESPDEGDFVGTENVLPPTHRFQLLRKTLMLFIYNKFLQWVASVRYIEPPGHRLRHKKQARMTRYLEEVDPNDSTVVIISPIQDYYHLACPFFVFNQEKHLSCILSHDFRSIEALLDHILCDHREPPFCPICGGVFDTFTKRDDHIRKRTCDPLGCDGIDGVNHMQRDKLVRRDHRSLPEVDRWCRIYTTIFDCKHKGSVYLTEGLGLRISLLRDYWARNGQELLREYLLIHSRSSACREQPDEVYALGALVFGDLMIRVQETEKG